MIVVKVIDDSAAVAISNDESQVAKESQLMGNRRAFHADGFREFIDRAGTCVEPTEYANPARSRQGLHGVGNDLGESGVELIGPRLEISMSHTISIHEQIFRYATLVQERISGAYSIRGGTQDVVPRLAGRVWQE